MPRQFCVTLLLGACLALTGCADIAFFGGQSAQTRTIGLYGGQVIAAAPDKFCIVQNASQPTSGFVVMARCDEEDSPPADGVITLQLGTMGTGLTATDATALEALLRSEAGRDLLSRSGNANAIRVETTELEEDTVTVRFRDRDPAPIPGLQSTEWRAFFDIAGRMATVSLRGLSAAPLGTDDGDVLLAQVIAALRQANEATSVGG